MVLVFAAGLVLGYSVGNIGSVSSSRELRKRLEQVNRDFGTAIESQREAAERASRLQTELNGVTEYARKIEAGTRKAQERTGNLEAGAEGLAGQLDGIAIRSGELADGIRRTSDSLEENRNLLNELRAIVFSIPQDSGDKNTKP